MAASNPMLPLLQRYSFPRILRITSLFDATFLHVVLQISFNSKLLFQSSLLVSFLLLSLRIHTFFLRISVRFSIFTMFRVFVEKAHVAEIAAFHALIVRPTLSDQFWKYFVLEWSCVDGVGIKRLLREI